MLHALRVCARLLLPVPMADALIALVTHHFALDDVALDILVLPALLVAAYSSTVLLVIGTLLGHAVQRRAGHDRSRLRLVLAPLMVLSLVPYMVSTFLVTYRPATPEGLPLALGAAALTLVPPLALLAYATHGAACLDDCPLPPVHPASG
jgi:hypothetical protein